MAAVSRRTDPPSRPSISPLSTTKSSPMASRDDATQNSHADEEDALLQGNGVGSAETGENADDDRSSSLSEPEEDDEEDARLLDIKFRDIMADSRATHHAHEIDSEAETERLEHTPVKTRKHADSVGRTPSKLNQAATADDFSEPPSPLPAGPDGDSSTSTGATTGKKRKRSNTADSSLTSAESDLGESPRKRTHETPDGDAELGEGNALDSAVDEQAQSETAAANDEPDLAAATAQTTRGGFKGRKGKNKGKTKKDAIKEVEIEEESVLEGEEDQDEEGAMRLAEELKHKGAASSLFEDIAKQFASFHDKLYTEKLAALSAEQDMLAQPDCRHPEYLRQVACVDARYAKQVSEVHAFYKYKMNALRITTLAERSQLHSQYFQSVRELREDVAYQLGEDWYKIQKERRQSNQGQDGQYILKFPTKRSEQLRNQAKYNQEVSVLSGVAKYIGFPAAPTITGAEGNALEDDLKSMKISKRTQKSTNHGTAPTFLQNRFAPPPSERIAHEQFIEQNAWAQPQGPIPNHGTPNLTHTPDWAETGNGVSAKHMVRTVSTPAFPRQAPGDISGASNEPDPPSGAQAALSTAERRSSSHFKPEPISPIAVTKQRQNGFGGERELTGFRNFSNISGTSTIDAPPDSAEKDRARALPAASPARHMYDASPVSRFTGLGTSDDISKQSDSYAGPTTSFRPRDGVFSSAPAPISTIAQGGRK